MSPELVTISVPGAMLVEAFAKAARAEIAARIMELDLDELGRMWRCGNRHEVRRKCRERGVPIRAERGRKEAYVLLADVESANERIRAAAMMPDGVKLTTFRKVA